MCLGTSLVVHAPNAGDPGSIPSQGTRYRTFQRKILHVTTKNPACHTKTEDTKWPQLKPGTAKVVSTF